MTDLTASINLYDSEIDTIHRVIEILRQRSESRRNYQEFQDEVKERFRDAGFVVDVVWYETNVEGVLMPEIVIKDRVNKDFQWDPNQQVHEVTNDLLSLGEGGVIKSDVSKLILPPGHGH